MQDNEKDDPFGDNDNDEDCGDDLEKIFPANKEKNAGAGDEQEEFFAIDDLVRERLEVIVQNHINLLVGEPFSFHPNAIIFHALYENEEGETEEVFLEISRLIKGFPLINKTIIFLEKNPATPMHRFVLQDEIGNYYGLVYEKIFEITAFEIYFLNKKNEICYFLSALKKLIEQLHDYSVVLPPHWNEEGIVYVAKDKMPVLIGYNDVSVWHTPEEFRKVCCENWCAFLDLIADAEIGAPPESIRLLEKLANEVYEEIEKTAVT
jgi:hypothetical protein